MNPIYYEIKSRNKNRLNHITNGTCETIEGKAQVMSFNISAEFANNSSLLKLQEDLPTDKAALRFGHRHAGRKAIGFRD